MRKLLLFICLLSAYANAQDQATLVISNVELKTDSWFTKVPNTFTILLFEGDRQNQYQFYSSSDFSLFADFRIDAINSRRSSVKSGSIRLKTVYRLNANQKRDKRTTEKIIYLGDSKAYEVVENFVLFNGLNSKKLTLTYQIKIN